MCRLAPLFTAVYCIVQDNQWLTVVLADHHGVCLVLCCVYLSVPGTKENEHLETDGTCGRMLL